MTCANAMPPREWPWRPSIEQLLQESASEDDALQSDTESLPEDDDFLSGDDASSSDSAEADNSVDQAPPGTTDEAGQPVATGVDNTAYPILFSAFLADAVQQLLEEGVLVPSSTLWGVNLQANPPQHE